MPSRSSKRAHVVYVEHYYNMDANEICGVIIEGVWPDRAGAVAFAKEKVIYHAGKWDGRVRGHEGARECRYWIDNAKEGADNFVWVVRETDLHAKVSRPSQKGK